MQGKLLLSARLVALAILALCLLVTAYSSVTQRGSMGASPVALLLLAYTAWLAIVFSPLWYRPRRWGWAVWGALVLAPWLILPTIGVSVKVTPAARTHHVQSDR